jgi:hypothetical protein
VYLKNQDGGAKMESVTNGSYTKEFREEAIKLVAGFKDG